MIRRGRRSVLKPLLLVAGLLAVSAVLVWLLWLRDPASGVTETGTRLSTTVDSLRDYRRRAELRLNLQLLAAEMEAGRRSADLRASYRMIDERMEPVLEFAPGDEAAALEAELEALVLALSRERMNAFESIERLVTELHSWAGPGRQGGN